MRELTPGELEYLGERRLARVATTGRDGIPHVTPVGMWQYDAATGTIEVSGHEFDSTKKFRDVASTHVAAIVIDDLASTDPWRPRGIEIRGRAEAERGSSPMIRIHPDRVLSWGLGAEN
jgi:pyridoxamine 5'-phosphate oxidase family protein